MALNLFFDRNGRPLDSFEWAVLFEDAAYGRVAETRVGKVRVSTVWVGLNQQHAKGTPLIFETMIFGGALDKERTLYATEAEALVGHAEAVERVRNIR